MTNPAILEALAARMWKAQAENSGSPASVSLGRTPEIFATQSEESRSSFLRYAAAVLELVGPKPLVWHSPCAGLYRADAALGLYEVIFAEETSMCFRVAGGVFHRLRVMGDTLEAAQAAAQAHADAAHWKNTKIGGK